MCNYYKIRKKNGELKERFLGFHDVSSSKTSESLFNLLTSVLNPYAFHTKLIAQCYDGASVMAGQVNGLQKKIRNDELEILISKIC